MILLVDDDAVFLRRAEHVLDDSDDSILFASTGADAIGLLKAIQFSIALVDLDLPDRSGFDLIQEIHRTRPAMPIVAISGVCSRAALESAREFGALETLRKPATSEWAKTIQRLRLCAS